IGELVKALGISTNTRNVQTLEVALHINSDAGLTLISTARRPCVVLFFILLGNQVSSSRCIEPDDDVIFSSRNLSGASGTRSFRQARCASTCLMKTFRSYSRTATNSSRPSSVFAFGARCSAGPADRIFIAPQGCSGRKYLFHQRSFSTGAPDNRTTTGAEAIGAL